LSNNLFLAPMAGITNMTMRLLAREQGASLCFTEMVSVNGLVREGQKSFDLLRSIPADRPLGIQLFGDDPKLLAEGARHAAPYGDLIDINMGCPVRKVVGTGAGSALLRDTHRIAQIIGSVRRATTLPLTVKIRSGWHAGDDTYREVARIAEQEGCDAITLHPRSRAQMFEGKSDWCQITEIKESVSIPVIGSGDLFTAADILRMLQETGCDAVMVARGALGNPWIFRQATSLLRGEHAAPPSPADRIAVARNHLELFVNEVGERIALAEMRKHLAWYAHGLPEAARFRATVNTVATMSELVGAMEEFFTRERP
ncbi:MAG TPA: tRNA dihydrouridine synthase DusB, partial [Geobacterales bacterium]|nr:tRNA dihydrouridine synthase DusB [Geobacterales bacterium]